MLHVRADVRIGGHTIDGNYNVLAYNYYPNSGDMVIDTADSFFTNTSNGSLRLRNTVAHEHGHGLGFAHSCPVNQTKLMEPYLSTAFDGPQQDEILGGSRAYGDDLEHNDTVATASDLGSLGNGTVTLGDLSVDDNGDTDYFMFSVGPNKKASVTVTPVGSTYLLGAQNSNGSCSAGTSFNSLTLNDVAVQLLDANGVGVLGTANAHPAGAAEALGNVVLPSGAGTYFVRVQPGTSNAAQLYQLSLTLGDTSALPDDLFSDGFDGPSLDAWSFSTTGGGDLATAVGRRAGRRARPAGGGERQRPAVRAGRDARRRVALPRALLVRPERLHAGRGQPARDHPAGVLAHTEPDQADHAHGAARQRSVPDDGEGAPRRRRHGRHGLDPVQRRAARDRARLAARDHAGRGRRALPALARRHERLELSAASTTRRASSTSFAWA